MALVNRNYGVIAIIAVAAGCLAPVAWGAAGVEFQNACAPGETITLAAVGDVLLHGPLQVQGFREKTGYASLWKRALPLLGQADIAYANLEGPVAGPVNLHNKLAKDPGLKFDNSCYTGYPRFNYNPVIVDSLVASGIDVVSTANNHAMDRGSLGADRTIDAMRAGGLAFTGTRKAGDQISPWHVITNAKGFKIAWVACTFSTNDLPDPSHQVLLCFKDRDELLKVVSDLASFPGIDAVIVTPHWGEEYESQESSEQRRLGRDLLEAGATAVIGSHPHVLQPWERYVTKDGREGFIIYSLGNFVSGQRALAKKTSVVLFVGLTRGQNHRTFVNGVRFVPLAMEFEGSNIAVFPTKRKAPYPESYKHAVSILNESQVMGPDDTVVTNPSCH